MTDERPTTRRAIIAIGEGLAMGFLEPDAVTGPARIMNGLRDATIRGARYNAERCDLELIVESPDLDPVPVGDCLPYFTPTFERLEQEVPT